jgi:hypothetical protein
MKKLNLCLNEWQARLVLEAIHELEAKWEKFNQTTQNEDERADSANDLVGLGMTKRQLTESGPSVLSRLRLDNWGVRRDVASLGRSRFRLRFEIYPRLKGIR